MNSSGFQQKSISGKESFGEQLKSARKKKKLSLHDVENDTKIRTKYLEAIESNRFDLVPSSYSKGFFRRYAEYLGLAKDDIKRELDLIPFERPKKQPFTFRPLDRETHWQVTPRVIASVFSVIVLLGFIGYITYQVKQFAAPPPLEILKPTNESVVTQETFTIEGKTEPGATVYVDNVAVSTGTDGAFTYLVTLRPGLNQITIRAENRIKKDSTRVVSVLYQTNNPVSTPAPENSATPSPTPSPQVTASPI